MEVYIFLENGCWNKISTNCDGLKANGDTTWKVWRIWSSVSKVLTPWNERISGFLLSYMEIQTFYFRCQTVFYPSISVIFITFIVHLWFYEFNIRENSTGMCPSFQNVYLYIYIPIYALCVYIFIFDNRIIL